MSQTELAKSKKTAPFCCVNRSNLCSWACYFVLFMVAFWLLQQVVPETARFQGSFFLAAAGLACLVNFNRNRVFHCGITGPLFLAAAALLALETVGIVVIGHIWLWVIVGVVVAVSLVMEQVVVRRG